MRLPFLLAALFLASCGSSAPPPAVTFVLPADPACPPAAAEDAATPSPARVACLQRAALRELGGPEEWTPPRVQFGLSARRLSGLLYGKPWEGCAAGVASNPIHVSLADGLARAERLVAWETANTYLWRVLGRADLTDGPLVERATNAAIAACGA